MFFRFDRASIVAYTSCQMINQVVRPKSGYTGWAYYPKGFFGDWRPLNRHAKRSMNRPKRVVFDSVVGGWVFEIEQRMIATRADIRPVGFVYASKDGGIPAQKLKGAVGFLATTVEKRVKVVYGTLAAA